MSWGYLSHGDAPVLPFGLGEADTIDRVEVPWPSGTVQMVTKRIDVNHAIEVRES